MKPLEMWGGIECTLNRIGDRYVNQCDKNGHSKRLSDIKMIADLGIKKLRYPCLWELVAPKDLDHFDWRYLDERLGELNRLGLSTIAGFLHHGSGPRYTSLIDPDFPEKLATYARAFARRYPWIEDYTPCNEINTTARFSCLYGHWYPHLKSDLYYLKALLLQCKGTILAMREIRRVNPKARLIQTDDIGRCQSTEPLEYQRDFENQRRWLSWDVLCGKITRAHPLYWYFIQNGITPLELAWFEENACPPDVLGLNHYHLSNRFLDHRLELYPEWSHGGNGTHRYADVGALDTGQAELPTPESIMEEAWERYGITLAITEVHTRGHREAQMRWLNQVWKAAKSVRLDGVNVEGITAWSLLGTYDWHNLCTKCEMFYEPGVFDLRNPEHLPRPTALSRLVKELATKGISHDPILKRPGWWKTPRRILWAPEIGAYTPIYTRSKLRPVLITGGTGTLGTAFARVCGARNIPYRLLKRTDMDIADIESVRRVMSQLNPWAVINTAGYVRVDDAEAERDKCFRENVEGAVNLAIVTAERNIPVVNFSSDLVFNGELDGAYFESHEVKPLNVYGESKAECEQRVREANPRALIIRTSSFFGPWDEYNFVTLTLKNLVHRSPVEVICDQRVSPTYVPDLADETLNLLIDRESGLLHLTNQGAVTWEEFARKAVELAKDRLPVDDDLLVPVTSGETHRRAPMPRNSVLQSERLHRLPPLEDALHRYFNQLEIPLDV